MASRVCYSFSGLLALAGPNLLDSTTGDNDGGKKIKAFKEVLRQTGLIAVFETADQAGCQSSGGALQLAIGVLGGAGQTPAGETERSHTVRQAARARPAAPLLWTPGSALRVRFLDGPAEFSERIICSGQNMECLRQHRIFPLSDDTDAEIRGYVQRGGCLLVVRGNAVPRYPSRQAHDEPWLAQASLSNRGPRVGGAARVRSCSGLSSRYESQWRNSVEQEEGL